MIPRIVTNSRFEHIADINMPTLNQPYQLPTNGGIMPSDRFIHTLRLQIECRMTNPATNGPTGVQADAPFSLIESIVIEGTHRPRGTKEQFINVRGADLRQWIKMYSSALSQPFSTFQTPASLSQTANATNDIRFIIDIPFVPLGVGPREAAMWLLDAPNYDSLQLTIRWADDKSVFTGQTNPVLFTAFGSATGTPRVRVGGKFAMGGGNRFAGFVPGRVFRYFQEYVSGDIIAGANASRIYSPNKGWSIRAIQLKSGGKSAAVTAGNNVYNTLSSSIFSNIKVFQGTNKLIRFWTDAFSMSEDYRMNYGAAPDTGYHQIDFAPNGLLGESLQTRSLVAGPTGDVDLFIAADIAGAAAQGMVFMTEECRFAPVGSMLNPAPVSMPASSRTGR